MIIRLDRVSREHFVILDTRASRDTRLTLKALGLHTYLMGMADDWNIRIDDLIRRRKEGKEAIQSAFKELREAGYAELKIIAGPGGVKGGSEWVIYETSRQPGNPAAGLTGDRENRLPENPAAFKKDQEYKEQSKGKKDQPPTPKGEEIFLEFPEDSKPKPEKPDHKAEAELLWAAYPRKVSKKIGIAKILIALKKNAFADLLPHVQRFALSVAGKDPTYIPHASTWFHQERWNDPTTDHETTTGHDYRKDDWFFQNDPNEPGI